NNMIKATKSKKQVIVVPTTQKSIPKTKPVKTLTTSRPVRSKENGVHKNLVSAKQNTLAYYNCLIDSIASPSNQKVKITQLAHKCKCSKGEVAQAQQKHKQHLVREVAKNYLAFGQSL